MFPNKDLDDLIILRSNGTPTYNLSVVVDDHDMGVTHIIRGDDHLTNAARQSQIYAALGWEIPVFAHLPLIHGPDGAKMSKRHGALGVDAYRAMGYLPAAMRNYLARLGWSHGDDEIFTTEQMIGWFGLDGLGKSPARFDFAKLENLNGHYIRATSDAELVAALRDLLPHLPQEKEHAAGLSEEHWRQLALAMPGLKERAKTLVELLDSAQFLFAKRPLALDEKAAKLLTPEARARLGVLAERFAALDSWTVAAHRSRGARICSRIRHQAWRRCPAVACRFDWAYCVAGHIRRALRAGPRGDAGAIAGSSAPRESLPLQPREPKGVADRRSSRLAGYAKKPAIYYCVAKLSFYALQQFADTVSADSDELNLSEETSDDPYGFGPDTGQRQAHAEIAGNLHDRRQADRISGLFRDAGTGRRRHLQILRARRAASPTIPATPRPAAAAPTSPSSTARKAFCCIAAIRSSSSPNSGNFLETCHLLLYGDLPNHGAICRLQEPCDLSHDAA